MRLFWVVVLLVFGGFDVCCFNWFRGVGLVLISFGGLLVGVVFRVFWWFAICWCNFLWFLFVDLMPLGFSVGVGALLLFDAFSSCVCFGVLVWCGCVLLFCVLGALVVSLRCVWGGCDSLLGGFWVNLNFWCWFGFGCGV